MKVAIFIGGTGDSGYQFANALNNHSKNEYDIIKYSEAVVTIIGGKVSILNREGSALIDQYDLVYLRGLSFEPLRHSIAAYLDQKKIKVVNSESHRYQVMSKLEQYVVLAIAGIPVPRGVYFGNPNDYWLAPKLLGTDFPIVVKSITGSNGNNNYLVDNMDALKSVDIDDPIFQSYIPNEFDYRVVVSGDRVVLSYKRIRNGTTENYRNNIGQGGRREIVELTSELKAMAIRAAKAMGREFSGLDILPSVDGTKHVILEVNFNFGTPVFDDLSQEMLYYRSIDEYLESLIRP